MKTSLLNVARVVACALTVVNAFAQTVPLTQDSYINSGSGVNFGTATTLNVGGPSNSQGLAQFDLSPLPAGVTGSRVAKATLAVFVNKLAAAGTVNMSVWVA